MGGRNPARVKSRAAAIEAEYRAGNVIGAMVSFDVGAWWMEAMAAYLPPEIVSHLVEMRATLAPHVPLLDAFVHEIAISAAPEGTDVFDIEMPWPAWEAAARVFLAGGDWEAAEAAALATVPA